MRTCLDGFEFTASWYEGLSVYVVVALTPNQLSNNGCAMLMITSATLAFQVGQLGRKREDLVAFERQ